MEILSQDDMDARISSARPLGNNPSSLGTDGSLWNIECPWESGTFISIMRAKLYAAELRLLVAEAERRQLKREFDREKERNASIEKQIRERCDKAEEERSTYLMELARLKKRLRNGRKR